MVTVACKIMTMLFLPTLRMAGRWPLGVDVSHEVEDAELKLPRAHN